MQIGSRVFDFSSPVIMGILNVTPDSFSDGGDFLSQEHALKHAMQMAEDGADIIDIGGESSRPGSENVSADEESRRVIPVISAIRQQSDVPISIDTTKSVVAVRAIEAGADMVNDISAGTFDPNIFKITVKAKVPICLMHMRGSPKTMQTGDIHYNDVVADIYDYLKERVETALASGVARDKIIIDPGIGFGKTVSHNVTILNGLKDFKRLELPLLIGTSRKSFIGKLLGIDNPKERLEGSLATIAIAIQNGADILRVHDVAETVRFVRVFNTCLSKSFQMI